MRALWWATWQEILVMHFYMQFNTKQFRAYYRTSKVENYFIDFIFIAGVWYQNVISP